MLDESFVPAGVIEEGPVHNGGRHRNGYLQVEQHFLGDGQGVGFGVLLSESPGNHAVVGEVVIQKSIRNDVAKAQAAEARFMAEHVGIGVNGVVKG